MSVLTFLVRDPRAEDAWNEFFHRFDEGIRRTVAVALRRYGRHYSADEAGDVVQQIYQRLIEKDFRALRNFRGRTEAAWRAYLARICYHLVADQGRAQAKRVPVNCENRASAGRPTARHGQPLSDPPQEDELHRRELQELIESSLHRTGNGGHAQRDRRVFVLRHYEGYSAEEVARALQLTTPQVNTIYCRTKKHITLDLAKILGKRTAHRESECGVSTGHP